MNQKLIWIILYGIIVAACIFIVVKRISFLTETNQPGTFEYIVLLFFILFTFINIRILIKRIKEYKK